MDEGERWGESAALSRAYAIKVMLKHGIADPERWLDDRSRSTRGSVPPKTRNRIGDRDRWICRICGLPVDRNQPRVPGLGKQLYADGEAVAALDDEDLILGWIGGDRRRAAAVGFGLGALDGRERDACGMEDHGLCGHGVERRAGLGERVRELAGDWPKRNNGCPSVEHLLPVCVGGGDEDENLAIAHEGCNKTYGRGGSGWPSPNQELIEVVHAARTRATMATIAQIPPTVRNPFYSFVDLAKT